MLRGTMPAISSAREVSPMAWSISCLVGGIDTDVAGDKFAGFSRAFRARVW
jgi:hypothetical protein